MNTVSVLLIDACESPRLGQRSRAGRTERFHVTRKATLSEGLQALHKLRFDLVLLSLSLPDASTSESVTRVVQMALGSPVIVLADEVETSTLSETLRLGAQDYVLKGCHCDCLSRAVQYAIERKLLTAERDHAQEQGARGRARLTAHLSHEMRNALACIHQFGSILVDGLAGELSAEQREYLGIMLQNASKIRRVLDSVLDAAPGPLEEVTSKL
jgi:DNA-binding NarL/FixJ family response regulator